MRDAKPIRTARRKTRRLTRLGSDHPTCFRCRIAEVAVLLPVSKKFLEDHHVVGSSHDPILTVPLCRNCHYLATENLLLADVTMLPEPDPVKRVAIMLRGLAVHHEMLAEACRRWAGVLEPTTEYGEHR
jgi:hypothetical protein